MIETPSPASAPGVSDVQTARQKLRDSLTAALDMVVSKQLVKSVLGVGEDVEADAGKEPGAVQNPSTLDVSLPASLSQVSLRIAFFPACLLCFSLRRCSNLVVRTLLELSKRLLSFSTMTYVLQKYSRLVLRIWPFCDFCAFDWNL